MATFTTATTTTATINPTLTTSSIDNSSDLFYYKPPDYICTSTTDYYPFTKVEINTQGMTLTKNLPDIIKTEVLSSRAIRFTFSNKKVIKTILMDGDTFDFKMAFYIAYAKLEKSKELTPMGISKYAEELSYKKDYVKKVEKAYKNYFKELKEKEKLEEKKKQEKENRIKADQKRKEQAKKKKQQKSDELTKAIVKAIKQANS